MGKKLELLEKTFGRLTVIQEAGKTSNGMYLWKCRCVCKNYITITGTSLTQGHTRSCGCLHKDMLRKRLTTHGHSKLHYYYRMWRSIKERCHTKTSTRFKYYGARGIVFHEIWYNDFNKFFIYLKKYIGLRPDERHTIDRIDNNKGYVPGNLRWVTMSVQNFNKRRLKEKKDTPYRGVYKKNNRYYAGITFEGKSHYLGSFKKETEAVQAYNKAAMKIYGEIPECNIL